MGETRICTRCREELPATLDYFMPRKDRPSGMTTHCRRCESKRAAAKYCANRERALAANKAWCQANPERRREVRRKSYAKYAGTSEFREHERQRYLRRRHTEEYRLSRATAKANRRARALGGEGRHSTRDLLAQRERQKGRCFWCKAKVGTRPHSDFEPDHVVPLALGGSNDSSNIVISCPSCNRHKSSRHPIEWAGVLC